MHSPPSQADLTRTEIESAEDSVVLQHHDAPVVGFSRLGVICLKKPWGEQKVGRPEHRYNSGCFSYAHCSHLVNTEDYSENNFAKGIHEQWLSAGSREPCG